MKKEIIELKFNITYHDISSTGFKITDSPYTKRGLFNFNPRMYLSEYAKMMELLAASNLTINDVIQVRYISGLTRPFGMQNLQIATCFDYYTVILKLSRQKKETIEDEKLKILKKFQTTTKYTIVKIYREYAMKYHPDRGGNEELMKYINTLKDRYK